MKQPGDTAIVRCPADGEDPETFTRGIVQETIAAHPSGSHAVHVITVTAFKWDRKDPWGPYDGVPQEIARETSGQAELEWIDTWPRRGR